MGDVTEKVNIEKVLRGCNVEFIKRANPLDLKLAIETVTEAVAFPKVSVVLFEAPCIAIVKPKPKSKVNEKCIGCKKCIREIGCPAISLTSNGKSIIDTNLCYGCTLCSQVCPVNAIGGCEA